MLSTQFSEAKPITPAFPNWERSFVSGPDSQLYSVEHRLIEKGTNGHAELITHVQFKPKAEGPPGHIHGGASAGLIDEVMGVLVWNQNYPCVTQTLNLKYLKPVPMSLDSYLITTIERITEKSVEVRCTICDQQKTPYVRAEGVFHRLTAEQLNRFIQKMK